MMDITEDILFAPLSELGTLLRSARSPRALSPRLAWLGWRRSAPNWERW